jgi:hypothetical protein
MITNKICVPPGLCTTSQTLESDWTLPPSVPAPHTFYVVFAFYQSSYQKPSMDIFVFRICMAFEFEKEP